MAHRASGPSTSAIRSGRFSGIHRLADRLTDAIPLLEEGARTRFSARGERRPRRPTRPSYLLFPVCATRFAASNRNARGGSGLAIA